jgi:trigger factor
MKSRALCSDCSQRKGSQYGATRPEGKTLSSTETIENTPNTETAEAAHDHNHDHDHEHAHGPAMNPECSREVVVDVPAEDVAKTYRKVVGNYRKYARIPGFRPGKAPESVIKRKFADDIRRDVIDDLLPERFNKAVADLGVKPVGQPQVLELALEEGAPLHVKAAFEFIPEFSIEGYQSVTVEKAKIEISDEEFNQELEQLRESRATIEPVEEDRALVDGDWAEISYSGTVDGEPEGEPLTGESALVEIGGKQTVEAFTTVLRGAKVGQELKAEVTYGEDYGQPKLAGKTVSYDVEVKAIKKRTMPELNDDLAKELGNYESLEDLKTKVREFLTKRKTHNAEFETKEKLMAALNERYTFAVPESLVEEQIQDRLERGLRALAAQGMTTEQMRQLDFERLRTAQRESALADARTTILLGRIADEENITITDEDLDRELQIAALQSREPIEALRARLTEEGGLARIREQMRREKTAQVLYERLPA